MSQFEKILLTVPDSVVKGLAEHYAGLFNPPLDYDVENEFSTGFHQFGFESFLIGIAVANQNRHKLFSDGIPVTRIGTEQYVKTTEEIRGALHQIAEPGKDESTQPCVPYQDLVKRVQKLEKDRIELLERIVLHLTTPPAQVIQPDQ